MLDMISYWMEEENASEQKLNDSGQVFDDMYLDGLYKKEVDDQEEVDRSDISAA